MRNLRKVGNDYYTLVCITLHEAQYMLSFCGENFQFPTGNGVVFFVELY